MILPWAKFKNFCTSIGGATHYGYVEDDSSVFVWTTFRGTTLETDMFKGDVDAMAYFNTSVKPVSNLAEAERVRITTCRIGRKLNSRFITFSTSNPSTFDNTNHLGVDFGDATYWMRNAAGALTTDATLAVASIVDFFPGFDYEVAGGLIFIPDTLPGDQNAWEIHAIGAPDIPAIYGGNVPFAANNRIKWLRGKHLEIDASLNPAEISGAVSAFARKIRFVLLHPAGLEAEFQINVKIFR